jgi:hypothetical protein
MSRQLLSLVQSIKAFADRRSNPVLEILPADGVVELDRRYPEDLLDFNNAGLRAYYHCHTASERPDNEHGHFHIFVRIPAGWSHVAGLSMDNNGQPLQWFTVNHWVTGEEWCGAEELAAHLKAVQLSENLGLTEQWLYTMLDFYHPVLAQLFDERDRAIERHCTEWQGETVLQERSIYCLSTYVIDLLQDISRSMPAPVAGKA